MGGHDEAFPVFSNVHNVRSETAPHTDPTLENSFSMHAYNEEQQHVVDVIERLLPGPDLLDSSTSYSEERAKVTRNAREMVLLQRQESFPSAHSETG